jgi:hypothetical protein
MSEPASTANSIPSATTATAAAGEPQASQAWESTPASEIAPGSQHSSSSATARRRISLGLGSQHSRLGQSARSFRRRSSEIFASTLAMFRRSGGKTGASVEMLRGDSGPDFEGYATVQRGEAPLGLNPFSCLKKRDKPRFLLIKGYHCFVFDSDDSASPKYAIELVNRRAVVQPAHAGIVPRVPHPGAGEGSLYTAVHLETSLGDVEYRITFAGEHDDGRGGGSLASKFVDAVAVASSEASTDQVRTRLGHGGLLNKRASVKFAQAVGTAKAKEQPEAPVSVGEIMAGMPSPVGYN